MALRRPSRSHSKDRPNADKVKYSTFVSSYPIRVIRDGLEEADGCARANIISPLCEANGVAIYTSSHLPAALPAIPSLDDASPSEYSYRRQSTQHA